MDIISTCHTDICILTLGYKVFTVILPLFWWCIQEPVYLGECGGECVLPSYTANYPVLILVIGLGSHFHSQGLSKGNSDDHMHLGVLNFFINQLILISF